MICAARKVKQDPPSCEGADAPMRLSLDPTGRLLDTEKGFARWRKSTQNLFRHPPDFSAVEIETPISRSTAMLG